jgi:hypothetical protein
MAFKMGQSLGFIWILISLISGLVSMGFTYRWNTQISWKDFSWRSIPVPGRKGTPENYYYYDNSNEVLQSNVQIISNPNLHTCFPLAITALVTGIIGFAKKQAGSNELLQIFALYGIAFGIVVIITVFINLQGLLQPPVVPSGL